MKRLTLNERFFVILHLFWEEDKNLLNSILTFSSLIYGLGFLISFAFGFSSVATLAILNPHYTEALTGLTFIFYSFLSNVYLNDIKLEKLYDVVLNYTGSFIWVTSATSVVLKLTGGQEFEPILLFFIFPIMSSLILSLRSFYEYFEK